MKTPNDPQSASIFYGYRLKKIRKQRKYQTQALLSKVSGVSKRTIWRAENEIPVKISTSMIICQTLCRDRNDENEINNLCNYLIKDFNNETEKNICFSVTFFNKTSEEISLFWLNFNNRLEKYADIQVEGSFTLQTYKNHRWVACGKSGNYYLNCLADPINTMINIDLK